MNQNFLIRTRVNTTVYGLKILDLMISKCFEAGNTSLNATVSVEELSQKYNESVRHTVNTISSIFSKNELTCSYDIDGVETFLSIFTSHQFDRKFLSVTANPLLKDFYHPVRFNNDQDFTTKYAYVLYNAIRYAMEDETEMVLKLPLTKVKGIMNLLPDENTSYNRFNNFKDKIFEPAIDEIKQRTALSILATYTKTGKQVSDITFHCKRPEEIREVNTDSPNAAFAKRMMAYYKKLSYSSILKTAMPEFDEKAIAHFLAEADNNTNKVLDAYIKLKETECKDPLSFMIERLRE